MCYVVFKNIMLIDSVQKPLRRIDIEEVSGKVVAAEVESSGSKSFIQEVVKEAEDESSPLSTSPSAKMIKIEEIAEVPSHSSDQLVALPLLFAGHFSLCFVCS